MASAGHGLGRGDEQARKTAIQKGGGAIMAEGNGSTRESGRPSNTRGVVLLVAFALLGPGTTGCDGILDVSLPGETPADAIQGPEFASLHVLSAQGDFECALSNFVYGTGHLSGELVGGRLALQTPYNTRDLRPIHQGFAELPCNAANPVGIFTPLSTARFVADDAYNRISEFPENEVEGRSGLLGRAAMFAGFAYTLFAETFCTSTFDVGPELSSAEVFELAEARFTRAIEMAQAAGDSETLNTALVGRARVRLAQGNGSGAVADAQLVPPGFEAHATRSNADNRRRNGIHHVNRGEFSVSIDEQFWHTEWMGVPDPRVELQEEVGRTASGQNPLFLQTKYTSEESPIRFASYTEAQLIIAEVEGGQTAVDIINQLHAAAGIPGFESDDPEEILQQVIEERRREFFLEGRRMADLRRYGGFAEAASAGQRNRFSGVLYGGTDCFPIPDVERRANPNLPS